MTTIPPTLSHELEGYEGYDPTATGTTDDLRGESEDICEATVERTGELCGRDLPCPYHD